MTAKFGIEIECLGLPAGGWSHTETAAAIRTDWFNVGYYGYDHAPRDTWKVVGDGSLSYGGCEVVSPPLPYNTDSLQHVLRVYDHLKSKGGHVDQSCGLHVHVDASFLRHYTSYKRRKFFEFLLATFQTVEPKFDQFVKAHRRGSQNRQYCDTVIGKNLDFCLARRYLKLNLCAYSKHGTIEFRQMHGTMDGAAVVAWIQLCVTFLSNVRTKFEAMYAEANPYVTPYVPY